MYLQHQLLPNPNFQHTIIIIITPNPAIPEIYVVGNIRKVGLADILRLSKMCDKLRTNWQQVIINLPFSLTQFLAIQSYIPVLIPHYTNTLYILQLLRLFDIPWIQ